MLKLIGSRLVLVIPQLLIIGILAFSLLYLVPGSAAALILGEASNPEAIERVEAELGLDQPYFVQLLNWLGGAVQGDLGDSFLYKRPVMDLVLQALPATLSLVGAGLLVAMIVGIGLGLIAGVNARRLADRAVTGFSALLQSVPEFWVGILLVLIFVVQLGWFPILAWTPPSTDPGLWLRGLVLPALALGAGASALIARQTRTAVAEALASRYADTLTAAGIPRWKIVFKYALKNAMIPVLAASALAVGILFGTSLVMERVFTFPGLGTLLVSSVISKDLPVVQGAALIVAVIVIAINLLVDIGYGALNPRARPQ
jgi:peptide/nickel transport system permease protein